jgi:hypothetical protein
MNSFQEKSASRFSGAFIVRKYLIESGSYLSIISGTQTAQLIVE